MENPIEKNVLKRRKKVHLPAPCGVICCEIKKCSDAAAHRPPSPSPSPSQAFVPPCSPGYVGEHVWFCDTGGPGHSRQRRPAVCTPLPGVPPPSTPLTPPLSPQRCNSKCVSEPTFYRLVQSFAVVLFE